MSIWNCGHKAVVTITCINCTLKAYTVPDWSSCSASITSKTLMSLSQSHSRSQFNRYNNN